MCQDSMDKYLAVFNISENNDLQIRIDLGMLGFENTVSVRSLWDSEELGTFKGDFSPNVEAHGAGLYKVHQ